MTLTTRLADDFAAGLGGAAAKVRRARLRKALAVGITRTAKVALYLSLAGFGVLLILRMTDVLLSVSPAWFMLSGIALASIPLILTIARAAGHRPSLHEVAERLDLALGDNNRIAIAYEFVTRSERSAFAGLAIEGGLAQLRMHGHRAPALDLVEWRLGPAAARAFAALLLCALGARIATTNAGSPLIALDVGIVQPQLADIDSSSEVDHLEGASIARVPQARESRIGTGQGAASRSAAQSSSHLSAISTAGNAAPAVTAITSSASVANAKAVASRDGVPAESSAAAKKQSGKPSTAKGGANGVDGDSNSGSGAGGQGRSDRSTSVSDQSAPLSTPPARLDARASDAEGEGISQDEEAKTSYQSGAQPLRQDRSPPGSRELGQSGTSGEAGNGRGGPGDTKKSRGAGAVFLSVPLPDYVRGMLAEGTSRVTRQLIPPQPNPMPSPARADAASPLYKENAIDRFEAPPEAAAALSRYFEELHREPTSEKANKTPAPTDASGLEGVLPQ
jgi:hypothetical protein